MKKTEKTRVEKEIEVLERLCQKSGAWMLGCTARTLRDSGIPRGKTGYHVHDLVAWVRRRAAAAGGGSPAELREALDQERLRKLQIANDKAEGILLPRRDVHELLFGLASALKSAGEAYQRRFGIDGAIILNAVLDKFDEELKALQTSGKGAGNE